MAKSEARVLGLAGASVIFLVLIVYNITANMSSYSNNVVFRMGEWKMDKSSERIMSEENMGRMEIIIGNNSDPLPERNTNETAWEMCKRKKNFSCIPAINKYETRWRTSPTHHISTCVIQKSMSTVMTSIMCFLFNETKFLENGKVLASFNDSRFCRGENESSSLEKVKKRFNINDTDDKWKYLIVTRDPVDRFLSGFVDKCIRKPTKLNWCNNCGSNMTCFLISEYERMKSQIIARRIPMTFEDRHFFPQSWRCGINRNSKKYSFIRYSSDPSQLLLHDLSNVLWRQNVSHQSIDFIASQLSIGRTVHSTYDSPSRQFLEKRLRSSPFLMEYIVKMFYQDYKLLNYSLPAGF